VQLYAMTRLTILEDFIFILEHLVPYWDAKVVQKLHFELADCVSMSIYLFLLSMMFNINYDCSSSTKAERQMQRCTLLNY
jgi:hypothetical protein